MKKVVSAGGIVIKRINGNLYVLLIIIQDETSLAFPKGHVDDNESAETAALREVTEETGLKTLKIAKKLGVVTRPSVEDDGTKVEKDIHLFLMETEDYNHLESDEEYGWFAIDEAVEKMGFLQEAEFLKKIKNKL